MGPVLKYMFNYTQILVLFCQQKTNMISGSGTTLKVSSRRPIYSVRSISDKDKMKKCLLNPLTYSEVKISELLVVQKS